MQEDETESETAPSRGKTHETETSIENETKSTAKDDVDANQAAAFPRGDDDDEEENESNESEGSYRPRFDLSDVGGEANGGERAPVAADRVEELRRLPKNDPRYHACTCRASWLCNLYIACR